MKNWSTNEKRLKESPGDYVKWKLEQMINFGLDGEKLPESALLRHFSSLAIDPLKKAFLKQLLWPTKS